RSLANKDITSKELERAMRYIESFVVRRAFNSKVSRDLNQVFARIAVKLIDRKGKNLSKILKDEKWPGDDHFKTCFVSSPIYSTAPVTAKFALESIERYKSADKELQIAKSQIEHVFPQQAAMDDWDSNTLSDLKKNLHVMGNLTLTAYNTKLSNHGFKEKKKIYKKSPYWLTKNIVKYDTWTRAEIEKRGKKLLGVAMKIWPGPPSKP
ncbi:MAG: HNH endonuclease family protein, partial [Nitrospirota bacterium]